jgi:hypothetical protein
MASKDPKLSKPAAAGTRHITLTIRETLGIIRNPGNATSKSVIKAAKRLDC